MRLQALWQRVHSLLCGGMQPPLPQRQRDTPMPMGRVLGIDHVGCVSGAPEDDGGGGNGPEWPPPDQPRRALPLPRPQLTDTRNQRIPGWQQSEKGRQRR